MAVTTSGWLQVVRMLFLAGCLAGAGCANYQVRLPDSDPEDIGEYEKTTMHALFWGTLVSPEVLVVRPLEERVGEQAGPEGAAPSQVFPGPEADVDEPWHEPQVRINDVVIERTLLHDLISVVTLGIWMPIDVHYRVQADDVIGNGFPEAEEPDDADHDDGAVQ